MGRPPSNRVCEIEDCGRKHLARGLCRKHYKSNRRHGNPLAARPLFFGSDLERLEHYSELNPETGCIEWTGATDPSGYGRLTDGKGGTTLAHRLALAARGVDIKGKVVRHLVCDNPPCINPDHLAVGSHADNVEDKMRAGRHGFRVPDEDRAEIYREYVACRPSEPRVCWRLGEKCGIRHSTVQYIVREQRAKEKQNE